jgi:hypothetical protein
MIEWIARSKKPRPLFDSVRKVRHTEKIPRHDEDVGAIAPGALAACSVLSMTMTQEGMI